MRGLAVLLGPLAVALALLGPRAGTCAFLALGLWCLPGWIWGWRRHGRDLWAEPALAAVHLAWGWIATTVLVVLMQPFLPLAAAHRPLWGLALGLALLGLPCRAPPSRPVAGSAPVAVVLMGAALAIWVILAYRPLDIAGPRGYAFVPYFDYDFLQHLSIAEALRDALPPANPYFAGQALHYYWLYHLLPASLLAWAEPAAPAYGVLALANVVAAQALFALVVELVAARGKGARAQVLALVLLLLTYSYHDVFLALRPLAERLWPGVTLVPSAHQAAPVAVSGLSHGLLRDVLYEGQALLGLFFPLWLLWSRPRGTWDFFIAGLWQAIAVGFDGLLGGLGAGALLGWAALEREGRARKLAAVALAGALVALGLRTLGMFAGAGGLGLRPHFQALAWAPLYLLLDFGPLVIGGGPALWRELRRSQTLRGARAPLRLREVNSRSLTPPRSARSRSPDRTWPLLAALSLCGLFFVGVAGHPSIVLRKAGKLFQLALAVPAAGLLAETWPRRRLVWAVVLALALPTTAIDLAWHLLPERNPKATWIAADDVAVCRWLRSHTPRGTLLLAAPRNDDYSLEPGLAGRPLYIGNRHHATLFQTDPAAARARLEATRDFYARAEVLPDGLRGGGIAYVIVSTRDAQHFLTLRGRISRMPGLREVFRSGEAAVYRVEP